MHAVSIASDLALSKGLGTRLLVIAIYIDVDERSCINYEQRKDIPGIDIETIDGAPCLLDTHCLYSIQNPF